jgi:hypothetical protein
MSVASAGPREVALSGQGDCDREPPADELRDFNPAAATATADVSSSNLKKSSYIT